MLTASAVNAAPRGGGGHGGHHGGHGAHFSSISPRGGPHGGHGAHFRSISPRGRHTFSRSGSKFRRGTSAIYGNRSARNWSGRNWSGRNWSGPVIGVAVTGVAIGRVAVTGAAAADSSLSAEVIRTTRIGIHIGAGAILTCTGYTAIILIRIILRIGTLTTVAPYQDSDSLGLDPSWFPAPAPPAQLCQRNPSG